MVRRLDLELSGYVAELGTDGRLLALQLFELNAGLELLRALLEKDYEPIDPAASLQPGRPAWTQRGGVAGAARRGPGLRVQPRHSPRHSDQRPRLPADGADQPAPTALGARLIEHFGDLQTLFGASTADLQAVDGVGESRARVIRDGLVRLAESAYTERME